MMTEITALQDLIATLDLDLPWLLPALEAFEAAVPAPVRLLVCGLLLAWLAALRVKSAGYPSPATTANG